MEGWIKIHRKITEWEWYQDTNTLRVFLHLLLTANYEDKKWQGRIIKRGQTITGRIALADQLNMTEQEIRTALLHLKNTGEINQQATNKYSIITIIKYEDYQITEPEQNGKSTSKQPANNQQTTTPKEVKKDKKIRIKKEEAVGFEKPTDYIDRIIDCFVEEHGNYQVVSRGKERAAAGKLAVIYKNKYPQATTDEAITGLRIYFQQCLKINDNWLRNNMSLPIIINKFNEINKILQNGNIKPGTGATPTQITGAIADHFGINPDRNNEAASQD